MIGEFFLSAIEFYKRGVSPLLPGSCKYMPTCSDYMYEAILRHGAFKGIFLGIYRLLRCNPFSSGGYDPVPVKFGMKSKGEHYC